MTPPIWITSPGFLSTVTENTSVNISISASGTNVTYQIISGSLPSGLSLNSVSGNISGIPDTVYNLVNSQFVARAKNNDGVSDRTFNITTLGPSAPVWDTASGILPVGPSNELYIINKQYINFQLVAHADILPTGQELFYFIADQDGQLPQGLSLSNTGTIYGFVNDQTIVDYITTINALYDVDPYAKNPYDFQGIKSPVSGGVYYDKLYQFYVTVTDGVSESKQLFKINVKDPAFLTVVEELPGNATSQIYTRYPVVPQWLIDTQLPTIRTNNRYIFPLKVYDPYPGIGPVIYSTDTVLPDHFTFNTATGVLSADLPYSSSFATDYTFSLTATKTFTLYQTTTSTTAEFSIRVIGDNTEYFNFTSPTLLGTLQPLEISELSLSVRRNDDLETTYSLIGGSLPPGLSLESDGTIVGIIPYDVNAVSTTYSFQVRADDVQRSAYVTKQFEIYVNRDNHTEYNNIVLKPFLSEIMRDRYYDFMSEIVIFDQSLMYRPYDPNFGVQKTMQMALYTGIESTSLTNYALSLQKYFYNKQMLFGDIKSAFAKTPDGQVLYEIVYVELIDNMVNNQGVSVSSTVTSFGTALNPNSINNMRAALSSIQLDDRTIYTDEFYLPLYQKTVQNSTGIPLNFIKSIPLCYVKPGNSSSVIKKINQSNFDFKQFNFEIDRIIILNLSDPSQNKYLMFPRKTIL